jgi:hypothetical protein
MGSRCVCCRGRRHTRIFKAPRAMVSDAFTDPERLARPVTENLPCACGKCEKIPKLKRDLFSADLDHRDIV